MNKIRVLLIEDNPFLRNGIKTLLNQQPDIKVIKATADFENATSSLSACKNGVVLLDLSLHDQNSLCVTEKLSKAALGPVIIVMDLFPQKEKILRIHSIRGATTQARSSCALSGGHGGISTTAGV